MLQLVPQGAVLQTEVPERAKWVRGQCGGVAGIPRGYIVDVYFGGSVGDGDEYGHHDVNQEVAGHHERQQAHAQQSPVAPAASAASAHCLWCTNQTQTCAHIRSNTKGQMFS